ncbi:MAG: hypothetical protein ACXU82_03590 [Caulobacteraceae bacterium]
MEEPSADVLSFRRGVIVLRGPKVADAWRTRMGDRAILLAQQRERRIAERALLIRSYSSAPGLAASARCGPERTLPGPP